MRARALVRRLTVIAATGFLVTGTNGCMSLIRSTARSYNVAANGLTESDNRFRQALVSGQFADAYSRSAKVKQGAPEDKLLRALYRGTTAFHAGEYQAAAASFAEADRLAEERETRSITRHAASLVTNDQVLSYLPSRTERLFTRYYAMMSWLRADSLAAATIEARRLGLMLQETADSVGDRERAVHAVLRDAAGAVFEAAGEANDALVSYRNAAKLRGATPQAIDSTTLATAHPDSATLVLFVESGFVAHRVSQEISFPLIPRRQNVLAASDATRRAVNGPFPTFAAVDTSVSASKMISTTKDDVEADADAIVASLVSIVNRPGEGMFIGDDRNWRRNRTMRFDDDVAAFGGPMLSLSWPALIRSARAPGAVQATAANLRAMDSMSVVGSVTGGSSADISDAIEADLRRSLPTMLTRLVVRAAAKAKIADAVGDKHGWWAGTLAGIAGDVLERADTRSWQLLPAHLTAVRMRVARSAMPSHILVGGDSVAIPELTRIGDTIVGSVRIFQSVPYHSTLTTDVTAHLQ